MSDNRPPTLTQIPVAVDITYLVSRIEELKRIAEMRGFGTLAYLLECAAIEAKWQADQQPQQAPQERPRT